MLSLRLADEGDLELIMAWRSNPYIFEKGCYTQTQPLTWEEHRAWWQSRGRWWRFFVVQLTESGFTRRVGVVNFGQLDNWNPEFNYYLGEVSLWGKGVGKESLQLGLDWLKSHGYCQVHTTVKDGNERSIGVLKSLGFTLTGNARVGETRWDLILSDKDNATEFTSGRRPFKDVG